MKIMTESGVIGKFILKIAAAVGLLAQSVLEENDNYVQRVSKIAAATGIISDNHGMVLSSVGVYYGARTVSAWRDRQDYGRIVANAATSLGMLGLAVALDDEK